MSNLALLFIESGLCLLISIVTIFLLRPSLRAILAEICGTEQRADFWLVWSQIMMVVSPLLLVIFFADARPGTALYPMEAVKTALFRALLGIFVATGMMGRVIWWAIVQVPEVPSK